MKAYENLKFMRLLMVVGSFSPLFILIAARGSEIINNYILILICFILIIFPNLILQRRIHIIKKNKQNVQDIKPINVTDQGEAIIIYLFAMLIPLFEADLNSLRGLISIIIAIIFLIFVFWKLNLHYINIFFTLFGYSVFVVEKEKFSGGGKKERIKIVLLSKKELLSQGRLIQAYRISDTVYIEKEDL